MSAHPDAPHPSGEDRFAVYTLRRIPYEEGRGNRRGDRPRQVRLAETSRDGLGITITTLVAEGEFRGPRDEQTPLGIFDRQERSWIVNPWAGGR